MDTKKFKINTTETIKSGKKITKSSILSKAGFTLVGAFAGAAFSSADSPEETAQIEEELVQETTVEEPLMESSQQSYQTDDDITEPQPLDSNNYQEPHSEDNQDDNDPNTIAQNIADEIDPNDIDSANVITPDSYDYAYLPDGTQQIVIVGHTPDGTEFILADIDGDGIYGDIFDTSGEMVAQIDGLYMSDILEMVDDTGGFLEAMYEPWEVDPAIVYEGEELAETEEIDESELEEDILAQLTEDVEEGSESRDVVIDDTEDVDDPEFSDEESEDDPDDEEDDDVFSYEEED